MAWDALLNVILQAIGIIKQINVKIYHLAKDLKNGIQLFNNVKILLV